MGIAFALGANRRRDFRERILELRAYTQENPCVPLG